jgi:cytoskeletal protein CcmA (bactofilin family)
MAEASERRAPDPALREGCEFSGLVVLTGPARIDGIVRGQVMAADLLWIGEAGRVEASVEAGEVVVAGHLEGEVRARSRIELLASARVFASLDAPRVSLAEGCHLEGHCRSGSASARPGRAGRAAQTPASP